MIEYRLARPEDAASLASLHARSWRENYRGAFLDAYLNGDLAEERLSVWSERLDDPPGDQFVELAADGTDLVGFVCAYGAHDPEWGSFIDNLHVSRACKGGGIGSSLMRHVGAWLDSLYAELGVYLWVLEGNSTARRFYERLGARNSGVSIMETHGSAMVQSCRYTWPRAELLSAGQHSVELDSTAK
jgi:ribosomal protein S18 acetylase RimI-like enzyme